MARVEIAEITLAGILQIIPGYIAMKAALIQVLGIPGTGDCQQMSLPLFQIPTAIVYQERALLLMRRLHLTFPLTAPTTLSPWSIQLFTTHRPTLPILAFHLLIHHCHQCCRNLCTATLTRINISLTGASLRLLRIPTGMVTKVVILVLAHIVLHTHHQLCFILFCLCMSSNIFSHHQCNHSLLPTRIPRAEIPHRRRLPQVAVQVLRPRVWLCHHNLLLK